MALRTDDRQWMIYDPQSVDMAFKALEAAAVFMYGKWLQGISKKMPSAISENVMQVGKVMENVGDARQQIQAGLSPNDVPNELVGAQRGLDKFNKFLQDPNSVDFDCVITALDELSGALTYMDERTKDTGTNHPRWNSRLVSGEPCESCGR